MDRRIARICGYNPGLLFAGGELGYWANISDLSTMFQDSAGTVPAVLGQPVGRINSANGNGVYASQITTGKKPILKRQPTSGIRNLLLDSDDLFAATDWSSASGWSQAEVNPYRVGMKSWRVTNIGSGTRYLQKNVGVVVTAQQKVFNVVLEKAPSDTAAQSVVSIYNSTLTSHAARVQLTWSTGAATTTVGTGGVEKLSESGPNGGVVYRIWCSGTVPVGDTEQVLLYPTGSTVNAHTSIVHGCQLEVGTAATNHQITVGGYDVYEPGYNQVYWLDYDGVDDELLLNNPDLGSNSTRISATINGPVIEQGLTLGADLTLNTDNLGLILINRALSTEEQNMITNYYSRMVA